MEASDYNFLSWRGLAENEENDESSPINDEEELESEEEDDDGEELIKNDEASKVVNMTFYTVGSGLVLMIVGVLVYFFVMRSKTIKISRKTVKKGPEHQMLALVTVDHRISSPDKILPMPYPSVSEKNISAD